MLDKRPNRRMVLAGVACAAALLAPARWAAGDDAMTVLGKVKPLPVGGILRHPANFFDLEGKTVTFTPDGAGGYAVRAGALIWVETSAATGRFLRFREPADEPPEAFDDGLRPSSIAALVGKPTGVNLPFAFPFAGRTWRRIHANRNGNLSFTAPETTHWEQRNPWPDGTMRSVAAAVDSRSAAGLEAMIAGLWAVYGETDLSVDSSPERVAITWNAVRRRFNGYESYEPLGRNLFQVRLYPSGMVKLAYRQVSESDGIVGLFHGTGPRGRILSAVDDDTGDVHRGPNIAVDIVSAKLVDNGSTVIASMTMADDIPDRVSSGTLMYRFFLNFDGVTSCSLGLNVRASGRTTFSSCGPVRVVGYSVRGPTLEIPISKILMPGSRALSWSLDAVWWGRDQWDQLHRQPVSFVQSDHDLSSMAETVSGNLVEVFHYPSINKNIRDVWSSIYGRAPADDEFALVFTDFRFDDLLNTGSGSGPINAPVQGIGDWQGDPTSGSRYGSDSLLSTAVPLFVGASRSVESGVDDNLAFHGHAWVVWWIAHELVHRWAAHLRFRDPVSGRIEDLIDDGCRCHWSRWLHAPVRHPVWRGYADHRYLEKSVMGGRIWQDNGDGTFTWQTTGFPLAEGLSDLDLYVMGMIPPEEVRPTFLLRDAVETDRRGVFRARKVPVTIEDIVAAMGPRVPHASEQRRVFRLGVYLLHEDGRAPRADLLERTRSVTESVAKYFRLATGGSLESPRPDLVTTSLEGPSTVAVGGEAHLAAGIRNRGAAAGAFRLGFYLSEDAEITTGDTWFGACTWKEGLAAGASATCRRGFPIPREVPPGRYHLGAIVDDLERVAEASETNNSLAAASGPLEILAGSISSYSFIPVILSASGKNNSFFTSELAFTNRGAEAAMLNLTYTAEAGGGSGSGTDTLGPHQQKIAPNAIEYLRGLEVPIPATGSRVGTLRVGVSGSSDVSVAARTTTPTAVPEGRAGLAYLGFRKTRGSTSKPSTCAGCATTRETAPTWPSRTWGRRARSP